MTNHERFHFFCKDLPSPSHFIDFNFYFLISACLGRKVWIGTEGMFQVFPNQYLIFVADPGIGKSLPANAGSIMLRSLQDVDETGNVVNLLNMGPSSITFRKLLIRAATVSKHKISTNGEPEKWYSHSSSVFSLSEIGTLFQDHTNDIVTFLNDAWDCGFYEDDTVSRGVNRINHICVNFLGSATPENVGKLMQHNIMEQGFTGRTIFIYGERKRKAPSLLKINQAQIQARQELLDWLKILCKLQPGEVTLSPAAFDWYDNWVQTKEDELINTHRKMKHYYSRKRVHIQKMAMLAHFARSTTMELEVEDFETGLATLESVEPFMHEALAAGGANPMNIMAEEIKKDLRLKGPMAQKIILLNQYHNAASADPVSEINRVLLYLVNTQQIKTTLVNGKDGYEIASKLKENQDK